MRVGEGERVFIYLKKKKKKKTPHNRNMAIKKNFGSYNNIYRNNYSVILKVLITKNEIMRSTNDQEYQRPPYEIFFI